VSFSLAAVIDLLIVVVWLAAMWRDDRTRGRR
jgi:hypothetical protein